MIARLIANGSGRLVCTQSYLDRCGTPTDITDLSNHEFIGFGEPQQTIDYLKNLDIHLSLQNFKVHCDNGVVSWEMVRAGMGLAFMDSRVVEKIPGLIHVLPELAPIEYPIWLTTHRELHTSQKIRLVFDLLAKMIPDAMGERGKLTLHQALFFRQFTHLVLQLLKRTHLDLADTLPAHIKLTGQLFQRGRFFLQTTRCQNRLLTIIQYIHGLNPSIHGAFLTRHLRS